MKASDLLNALALPFAVAQKPGKITSMANHIRLADWKASATDLVSSVEVAFPADLGCCAPAVRLRDALGTLPPDADVKLKVVGTRLTIAGGRTRHSMATLPVADFPMPKWPTEETPIKNWATQAAALDFTRRASAVNDLTRAWLNGVATQKGGFVASNGHWASIVRSGSEIADDMILPAHALNAVSLLKNVTAAAIENGERFALIFEGGRYMSQLVAGKYADMSRIVPITHNETPIVVERAAIEGAARAARGVQYTDYLQLSIAKDLIILEEETSEGSARFEVVCSYAGPEISIGINSGYLVSALESLEGTQVTFSQAASTSPIMFTGAKEGWCHVIMAAKL